MEIGRGRKEKEEKEMIVNNYQIFYKYMFDLLKEILNKHIHLFIYLSINSTNFIS